jgi:hypothetical protein
LPPNAYVHRSSRALVHGHATDFGWGAPRRVALASAHQAVGLGARGGGVPVTTLDLTIMDAFIANFIVSASGSGNDE